MRLANEVSEMANEISNKLNLCNYDSLQFIQTIIVANPPWFGIQLQECTKRNSVGTFV